MSVDKLNYKWVKQMDKTKKFYQILNSITELNLKSKKYE